MTWYLHHHIYNLYLYLGVLYLATPEKNVETHLDASRFTNRQNLAGCRILVVEDAPDNQLLISRFLKLEGATVALAGNGQEALDYLALHDVDVVLMDIQMPVMDGFEAAQQLRGQGCKVPLVALTAHALNHEREQCFTAGFNEHLSKPIDFRTMTATIQKLIRQLPQ